MHNLNSRIRLWSLLITVGLIAGLMLPPSAGAATDIFMAPDGIDVRRDGSTPAMAVKTLNRVQEIAADITGDDIDVQIAPGDYHEQYVTWNNPIIPGQVLTFRQQEGESGWPTFVGGGTDPETRDDRPFFFLPPSNSDGQPTNLRFWHLKVQDYIEAIIVWGSESDEEKWNSRNEVIDSRFARIGGMHAGDHHGFEVIGLVNSRNNRIQYNRFVRAENNIGGEALIHGIYLAHWATGNNIRRNFFSHNSGDPVKTRDQSGANYVWGNAFWRSGQSAATVGDWYRNPERVNAHRTQAKWDARGQRWECPSFNNNVRYNDYSKDYQGRAALPQVKAVRPEDDPSYAGTKFQPDWVYFCPEHNGGRFSTAGNHYQANWSTIQGIVVGWEAPGGALYNWREQHNIE